MPPRQVMNSDDYVILGCVIGPGRVMEWQCRECGTEYSVTAQSGFVAFATGVNRPLAVSGRPDLRIASPAGAAFSLTVVPDVADGTPTAAVDVEFLSPDRQVRYLGRPFAPASADALAEFLYRCADDRLPQVTLQPVIDVASGLSVAVLDAGELDVNLEISLPEDPEDDEVEPDGLDIVVPRSSLVTASQAARRLFRALERR
ncbi:hypothetical protein [Isoptericola variabilis]|nr:hypothetical protein [Isoptericola variabilis]